MHLGYTYRRIACAQGALLSGAAHAYAIRICVQCVCASSFYFYFISGFVSEANRALIFNKDGY